MLIETKTFEELNVHELFEIYQLRAKVFIVEQNCAYQDVDDKDKLARHVLIKDENHLIAYARILPPGLSYSEPAIGRVVVDPNYRKKNFGKDLMKYCISKVMQLYNNQDIVISAQMYLLKFYSELGFETEGLEYLEDNIPHIQMRYLRSE